MAFPISTQKRLPEQASQVIDRSKRLTFTFDGQQYSAYEGDTIASALTAAGVETFTNSLHYRRQRGLLCGMGNCANCLVQVADEPDVRACATCVSDGMAVETQNAEAHDDTLDLVGDAGGVLPAGFVYKNFMQPREMFPVYEQQLRAAEGFGKVDLDSVHGYFDKEYKFADVTVIGGGAAGMRAALSAADSGANVILMEIEPALGGHLRYEVHPIEGHPAYEYAAELAEKVSAHPNIEVMTGTTAFGRYDDNWIGATQGNRLIKLRTKSLVVTSGAYETPLLFENNDLPGVMLAAGVRRLIHLYGVLPGKRAVVVSANARGLQAALDMQTAGIEVAAVAEMRKAPDADLVMKLAKAGIRVLLNTTVIEAKSGEGKVRSAVLRGLDHGETEEVSCDLLVISTGYMPAYELLYQAGAKLVWDEKINEFTPGKLPENIFAAGEVSGTHTLPEIEQEGQWAGLQAAQAAGFEGAESDTSGGSQGYPEGTLNVRQVVEQSRMARQAWTAVHVPPEASRHEFVCLCEDVTRENVKQSIDEGFDSMELLKRYSTISTGPCQGRMCGMTTMQLCAHYKNQTIAETGTTTSRPPARPLTMGVLAGRSMDPVRVTALHEWHTAHGAKMMNAGVWKRPEHYGNPQAEVTATRNGVGLIDISTLGKFHLTGADVPKLLEKLYVNRWAKLGVGRVRYGVMLNQEGVMMDDGVTARLSDDFFYMTATSSGAT
ncbi:MAG: 2Fe-2S iron-sulfur cluster-binding protein, partial [Chloroflexota bacterium]